MSDFPDFFCLGYPIVVNRTKDVKGSVVVVQWKNCTASLFTIYHRVVFSENDKSHWSGVNVSGHEIRYDLNLSCHKEYEIAMTAWNSTAETPLKALNHNNMWRVTTLGGNVIKISSTVEPRSTDTCLIRTPRYYGQFCLSR